MTRKPHKSRSQTQPSKASTAKTPASVPQKANAWYCAVRKLRTWISVEEDGDQFVQPIVVLVIDQDSDMILDVEIVPETPDAATLQRKLFGLMVKPPRQFGFKPHRPAEVHFEQEILAEALAPLLDEVGVHGLFLPQAERMDALIEQLQSNVLGGGDLIPGLLSQPGVTPELVGEVFAAALKYYRAEPWVVLENEDLLAVRVGAQAEPYYVMVLGAGGTEYGLSVARSWESLVAFFGAESPQEVIEAGSQDAFLFNQPPFVSIDDLEAIEQYGWEVPAVDLIPTPWIVKDEGMIRPDAGMLNWYAAALRAIPVFTQEHLQTNPDGTHPDVEALIEVDTLGAKTPVRIRYPGGDLSQIENRMEEMVAWEADEDEDDEEGAVPSLVDRRAIEGDLARLTAGLGGLPEIDDPRLAEAQERMYAAWEERRPARRIALAKEALEISPNCADAYVLLAEEQAKTLRQAHDLFKDGVAAGWRALGEAFFKDRENVGHFWGILSTRPYMRAMEGLAHTQWELGQFEESLKTYRELLRLNPNDNQGIRYVVLNLLLEMGRDDEARKLLAKYKGDYSADWAYASVLLTFKKEGDQPAARRALQKALNINRHVADYLTGKKRMPATRPAYVSPGSEDEAVVYVGANLGVWRRTEGALAWLKAQVGQKK